MNLTCRSGIDARSLFIISMGELPILFSKFPCEKNSSSIMSIMSQRIQFFNSFILNYVILP